MWLARRHKSSRPTGSCREGSARSGRRRGRQREEKKKKKNEEEEEEEEEALCCLCGQVELRKSNQLCAPNMSLTGQVRPAAKRI